MANSAITAGQLQRAREVFESASAEQGAAREAILHRGCADDPELRALVEQMIAADDRPQEILDRPLSLAAPEDTAALQAGAAVGPYRIVREIGSGGMGTVYLAERTGASVPEFYAIKIVRWWSPELSRRFQQEQRILSGLQHPHIARLVDSGITGDHSPYFVMEYVDGRPIHQFCEGNDLSTDERLQLFHQVSAAVQYLHQNLVVHRDLKPSNVLVTAEGSVKLVDFGIAKLLQSSDSGSSLAPTSLALMTPDYASPEQIRSGPTSTLTDVYTLGVLLYELLTGARPFAAPNSALHETLRRICEDEPERPSAAASRGKADRPVRLRMARKLRGELDNIILKALRKTPEERYASVEQFDADLDRYLKGLPVLAQGDSLFYQTRKFVARHKAGMAAAVAMLMLLGGGIIATSIEAGVARQQRARAEAQAREAESAKALAERQRQSAEQARAAAERRLEQLQSLARGAVEIYNSSGKTNVTPATSALIAETARNSLLALHAEGVEEPRLAGLLEETSAAVHSYELVSDATWQIPTGWSARQTEPNEYRVGVDRSFPYQGKPSLFLRSLVLDPTGSVAVFQGFSANRYRGTRVRLAGYLRGEQIGSQATLWVNITGDETAGPVEDAVYVSGTGPWKRYEMVLNVPAAADAIQFGFAMSGRGTLWASGLRFEQVSATVPLTARKDPANLSFTKP